MLTLSFSLTVSSPGANDVRSPRRETSVASVTCDLMTFGIAGTGR